jgi:hypothetical protein
MQGVTGAGSLIRDVRRPHNVQILPKLLTVLWAVTAFSAGWAQETRILSFERNETLTWTNAQTNVYCGFEFTGQLPGGWASESERPRKMTFLPCR